MFRNALWLVFFAVAPLLAQERGTFTLTGDMTAPRSEHTATLLADGRVLVAGGFTDTTHVLSSAEIYDPSTGAFSRTGNMAVARRSHTATLLFNGMVLITGGFDQSQTLSSAELFDPASGTFSSVGDLVEAQGGHTATLLPDGNVLITGASRAELYDAESKTFSVAGDYAPPQSAFYVYTPLVLHTATLLRNGTVLVIGGVPPQIFDPAADQFRLTTGAPNGVLSQSIEWHTATPLRDGTVLITGGNDDDTCGGFSSAEIYDPARQTFSSAASMSVARDIHTATLLADGTVLIAGGGDGWCGSSTLDSAEIYDPSTRSFHAAGHMSHMRSGHTATLLNDGTVLITGGFSYWPYDNLRTAELYHPAPSSPSGRRAGRR